MNEKKLKNKVANKVTNKVTYKVVSVHEAPELTKIEKGNITTEITLADTLGAIEQNAKGISQIESEVRLKKALITNVVTNHPEVLNVDLKMQIAVHTYYEANRYIEIAEIKLKEFDEAQTELKKEVDEIKKQTGVSKITDEQKNEIMKEIKNKLEDKSVDEVKDILN